MRCPNCGEERQIEVAAKLGDKLEIYCNTCGKISIIPKPLDKPI